MTNDRLLELVKESGAVLTEKNTWEFYRTEAVFHDEQQLRTLYELIRKEVVPEGYVVVPIDLSHQILEQVGCMNNYDSDSGCADSDHIHWWQDVIAASKKGE